VIDATGDGHVLASAGCAFELERVHPWLWFRIGGVTDVDAAIAAGAPIFRTTNPGQALLPWGSMARIDRRIDATDPRELSFAELECRRLVMEEFRGLRARFAELRDAHLCEIARLIGITESRRLVGRRVLLRADRQKPQADAIAITGHWTKYGAVYAIRTCLVPNELDNLLVTGRCIRRPPDPQRDQGDSARARDRRGSAWPARAREADAREDRGRALRRAAARRDPDYAF
jgi:hypothetical protein